MMNPTNIHTLPPKPSVADLASIAFQTGSVTEAEDKAWLMIGHAFYNLYTPEQISLMKTDEAISRAVATAIGEAMKSTDRLTEESKTIMQAMIKLSEKFSPWLFDGNEQEPDEWYDQRMKYMRGSMLSNMRFYANVVEPIFEEMGKAGATIPLWQDEVRSRTRAGTPWIRDKYNETIKGMVEEHQNKIAFLESEEKKAHKDIQKAIAKGDIKAQKANEERLEIIEKVLNDTKKQTDEVFTYAKEQFVEAFNQFAEVVTNPDLPVQEVKMTLFGFGNQEKRGRGWEWMYDENNGAIYIEAPYEILVRIKGLAEQYANITVGDPMITAKEISAQIIEKVTERKSENARNKKLAELDIVAV